MSRLGAPPSHNEGNLEALPTTLLQETHDREYHSQPEAAQGFNHVQPSATAPSILDSSDWSAKITSLPKAPLARWQQLVTRVLTLIDNDGDGILDFVTETGPLTRTEGKMGDSLNSTSSPWLILTKPTIPLPIMYRVEQRGHTPGHSKYRRPLPTSTVPPLSTDSTTSQPPTTTSHDEPSLFPTTTSVILTFIPFPPPPSGSTFSLTNELTSSASIPTTFITITITSSSTSTTPSPAPTSTPEPIPPMGNKTTMGIGIGVAVGVAILAFGAVYCCCGKEKLLAKFGKKKKKDKGKGRVVSSGQAEEGLRTPEGKPEPGISFSGVSSPLLSQQPTASGGLGYSPAMSSGQFSKPVPQGVIEKERGEWGRERFSGGDREAAGGDASQGSSKMLDPIRFYNGAPSAFTTSSQSGGDGSHHASDITEFAPIYTLAGFVPMSASPPSIVRQGFSRSNTPLGQRQSASRKQSATFRPFSYPADSSVNFHASSEPALIPGAERRPSSVTLTLVPPFTRSYSNSPATNTTTTPGTNDMGLGPGHRRISVDSGSWSSSLQPMDSRCGSTTPCIEPGPSARTLRGQGSQLATEQVATGIPSPLGGLIRSHLPSGSTYDESYDLRSLPLPQTPKRWAVQEWIQGAPSAWEDPELESVASGGTEMEFGGGEEEGEQEGEIGSFNGWRCLLSSRSPTLGTELQGAMIAENPMVFLLMTLLLIQGTESTCEKDTTYGNCS
ncbi:hypothetical protein L211DRAFT_847205 [Terfezia boudieri ATCC MYA-4762]|uniref:Uncharacterized protein n=1 Tax=Terfezia boudieri ATCC MYA-4762 TaxID=1051890 RepID=A0A3N4LXY6_9PEZI|nr:hypothetical protein L211DRAFT_847205 [Terfezia boudieri ATCC MYA-4762]